MTTHRRILILVIVMLAMSLLPLTAQAAVTTYTWQPTIFSGTWDTVADWSGPPPAGGPNGSSAKAVINNSTATTVTLNTAIGGTTALNNLTLGSTTNLGLNNLIINSPGSLKATTITMNGGSITGLGTVTGGSITGTGTVSSKISGATSLTASGGTLDASNATGTTSGSVNAKASGDILNVGAVTFSGGANTFSGGDYVGGNVINFNGTTLQGVTGLFNSTMLYGLGAFNVTGTSTMVNNFAFGNLSTMSVSTGATLQLNAATYGGYNTVTGGGNMTLNPGATLNNISGTGSTSTVEQSTITMKNASITNTGGGTFNISDLISGTGNISGVTNHVGGISANGGLLTFNGGTGAGTSLGSSYGTGDSLGTAGAGSTLDLKGNFSLINPLNIGPNGGVVQLDGANFANSNPWNFTLGSGTINVTNNSTLNGPVSSGATLGINSGKTLDTSGATVNFTGGSLTNSGTLAVGAGTLNNQSASAYSLTGGGSATLAGATIESTGGGGFTSDNAVSGYGNLSTLFTNNGSMNITGGILNVTGSGQIKGTGNVTITDPAVATGLSLQTANTLFANNFTMGPNTTLAVGTASLHPLMELTGNYSFQQTNPLNWTNGTTTGLGPDLKMAGTAVQTLEVGGVNLGATPLGMTNNFALKSLTIAPGADVKLVDLFPNATTSGWTSGSEALYLGALILGGAGDPIFDLNGIYCYVNGVGLQNGLYNGITIEGSPESPVPISPSVLLLGSGLLGMLGLGWRRKTSE